MIVCILLLVFSVTPFKIDQNKNQNRSIDKVQNLGNERRYIYKDPRQDSGQRNLSYTRYPKKCFTQTYRDLYGDAMLVLTWMSSNMADGNQQKHLLPSFATKAKFPEVSHFLNLHDSSPGRHVNAASRKSLEIQAYSITKTRTPLKRKFV